MRTKILSLVAACGLLAVVIGCGPQPGEEPSDTVSGTPLPAEKAAGTSATATSETGPAPGDRTAVPAAVPEIAAAAIGGRRVIVLALDGADWGLLDSYIEAGTMPELGRLVAEGNGGTLLSEHPPLSPLLWTTMVTGTSPLEHQILDFTRYHPATGLKEPITSDERRRPAIWNMATQAGRSVAIFGLWATFPAEAVHGLLVSDRMLTFLYQEDDPPPGVVYPPEREAWARRIRRQVEESIGFDALRAYLPWLEPDEYERHARVRNPYGHPIGALRRILVETEVYHRMATEVLSDHPADLSLVFFQGSDSVGHVFAPYAPPRQDGISAQDFERYSRVPQRFFARLDEILGDYRRLAEEQDAVLLLVSDHGFRWRQGRPTQLSSFAIGTAARWHREEGIYLLWGPGIRPPSPGARHAGEGGLRRVCATLLSLLGLPPGSGVTGPSLPGALDSAAEGRAVPEVDYRVHYRPSSPVVTGDGRAAEEEIAKLRALGYLGASEPGTARNRHPDFPTRSAGSFNNQGLLLKVEGRKDEALTAFETALEIDPDLASALWNLSDLLYADKDLERSDRLLLRAVANRLPEGVQYLIGRAIGYHRNSQAERSRRLLDRAVEVRPDESELWLFRGRYLIEGGDCATASQSFDRALELDSANPGAYAAAAMAKACLGDREGAVGALRKSLELDPNQPAVEKMIRELG